jgi:hypothetical protein
MPPRNSAMGSMDRSRVMIFGSTGSVWGVIFGNQEKTFLLDADERRFSGCPEFISIAYPTPARLPAILLGGPAGGGTEAQRNPI